MPARQGPHTQDKTTLKATFCLVRKDDNTSPHLAHKILSEEVLSIGHEVLKEFKDIVMYVQSDERIAPEEIPLEVSGMRGRITYFPDETLQRLLTEKRRKEGFNRKQAGHVSYTPSAILSTRTYVVVLGTQGFLTRMLRIHMEEIPGLREKLLDALEDICDLQSYHRVGRKTAKPTALRISVAPDAKDYITYNLRYVAERLLQTKMSLEEGLARIAKV